MRQPRQHMLRAGLMIAALVCVCFVGACKASRSEKTLSERAPLIPASDLITPASKLPAHKFWVEPEFEKLPSSFEDPRSLPPYDVRPPRRWMADVPMGTPLTLWPGADPVESCLYDDQSLFAWDRKEVRYVIEGSTYVYYPIAPWTRPEQLRALEDTIVYSEATATPYALLPRGTRVLLLSQDEDLARICLDPPSCSFTGNVRAKRLGQVLTREREKGAVDPKPFPLDSERISNHTDAEIELRDIHGRLILAPFVPWEYRLIHKGEELAEIVVPYDLDRESEVKMVYLHGFIDAKLVPEQDPDAFGGDGEGGLGGYGRHITHMPTVYYYIPRGAWVYGAPDEKTRFAQVRARWAKLWQRKASNVPFGWLAAWIDTPWGVMEAYVQFSGTLDKLPPNEKASSWDPRLSFVPCPGDEE